ncbi:hypothetical protein SPRG_16307 [Saprolegnia parasitica CBS 223.65]|uniref:Uncharacterized protein n=1 Tax=Saprolegnia parasitica (strain CBS 223.65) TaxID=695850 RepID=A0A067BJ62_SAPPC|nr:hypothetical protein SPRG_16307 [Saprolegnia parasitica CBS 223.65]KDO18183.1 hypothetical protein SPRG_16307 [Saprolegnia parasitica CBS 223.65]|eukprot:XP_012211110.1 hypothetical protein SPRG_16307 [Saprolegnia parasitica CBS 223.65]
MAAKYDAVSPEIRQYLRATLTPVVSIYVHCMHQRRLRAFLLWRMHVATVGMCAAQALVTDRLRTKRLVHGLLRWKLVVTQYARIASYAPEYMHWIARHPSTTLQKACL